MVQNKLGQYLNLLLNVTKSNNKGYSTFW